MCRHHSNCGNRTERAYAGLRLAANPVSMARVIASGNPLLGKPAVPPDFQRQTTGWLAVERSEPPDVCRHGSNCGNRTERAYAGLRLAANPAYIARVIANGNPLLGKPAVPPDFQRQTKGWLAVERSEPPDVCRHHSNCGNRTERAYAGLRLAANPVSIARVIASGNPLLGKPAVPPDFQCQTTGWLAVERSEPPDVCRHHSNCGNRTERAYAGLRLAANPAYIARVIANGNPLLGKPAVPPVLLYSQSQARTVSERAP